MLNPLVTKTTILCALLVLTGCGLTKPAHLMLAGTSTQVKSQPTNDDGYFETQNTLMATCGDLSGLGIWQQRFASGDVITGPATLFSNNPSAMELAAALKLSPLLYAHWGINVPAGQSVRIPEQIELNLLEKTTWKPTGLVIYFANEQQLRDTAWCRIRLGSP